MKVVQINITYNHGSTGIIVRLIENMLRRSGDEAFVVYNGYHNYHLSNDYPIGNKWVYRVHAHCFTKWLDREGFGSFMSTKGLCRWLDKVHPDIIHLHNIHGSYVNLPVLFNHINRRGIPVVMTLHDCWTMTGHCYHFDAVGCIRWQTGCYDCPLHRKYPISIGPDNSRGNYKNKKAIFTSINRMHIVSVSHFIDNTVSRSYLNMYPHTVIHNGVDLNVFKPIDSDLRNKLGISHNKIVLLGVSSKWNDAKGLAEMIWLSEDSRFQVILIGVQEGLIDCLPKEIIAMKRTESQTQLAEFYSMADIFVNPTYNDSFPTVNLESLACGTPIITYRTGGSPEAIDDKTGIVVERGDRDALKDAIVAMSSWDFKECKQYCLNRASECFDQNNCYTTYLGIYKCISQE